MRAPLTALLLLMLSACATTPQWSECSREECDPGEPCQGGCPDGYECARLATSNSRGESAMSRPFCSQRCEGDAARCTDPGTAGDGETTCGVYCIVSCEPTTGDCPPGSHCEGHDISRAGLCFP